MESISKLTKKKLYTGIIPNLRFSGKHNNNFGFGKENHKVCSAKKENCDQSKLLVGNWYAGENIPDDEKEVLKNVSKAEKTAVLVNLLNRYTDMKHMRVNLSEKTYVCWFSNGEVHKTLTKEEATVYPTGILVSQFGNTFFNQDMPRRVLELSTWKHNTYLEATVQDYAHIGFKDGWFNLDEHTLNKYDAKSFVFDILPYNYKDDVGCGKIMCFLKNLCDGYEDRLALVRCIARFAIQPSSSLQKFLFIFGQGGSGKSTFCKLLEALVEKKATIVTSLRNLKNSSFEAANFEGKKLALHPEQLKSAKDYTQFFNLVGGESVAARVKFVQGTREFVPDCFHVISTFLIDLP